MTLSHEGVSNGFAIAPNSYLKSQATCITKTGKQWRYDRLAVARDAVLGRGLDLRKYDADCQGVVDDTG